MARAAIAASKLLFTTQGQHHPDLLMHAGPNNYIQACCHIAGAISVLKQ